MQKQMNESVKVDKLEGQLYDQQKLLGKIEASLENIEKHMMESLSIKDIVTRQEEKHRTIEKNINSHSIDIKDLTKSMNNINIKIAMASGVWGAIVYFVANL